MKGGGARRDMGSCWMMKMERKSWLLSLRSGRRRRRSPQRKKKLDWMIADPLQDHHHGVGPDLHLAPTQTLASVPALET